MSLDLNTLLRPQGGSSLKTSPQLYMPKSHAEKRDFFINIGQQGMSNKRSQSNPRSPIQSWRKVDKSLRGGLFVYKNLDMSDIIETKPQPLIRKRHYSQRKPTTIATQTEIPFLEAVQPPPRSQTQVVSIVQAQNSNYKDRVQQPHYRGNTISYGYQISPKRNGSEQPKCSVNPSENSLKRIRRRFQNSILLNSSNIKLKDLNREDLNLIKQGKSNPDPQPQETDKPGQAFEIQPNGQMTEQSPKAELPTNEVELLNWIVDKVVEEGILPQEAAESSKESIQKIVRNNIEYFLHQLKVCNCYVCTCGQCRCNAPAFKPLYFSNLSRPVVQRDPNINISLNSDNYETLAYQHRVKQRSPDQYETSNQRTYKPFTAQLSPLPRYSPLPTMPFIARSNYQDNFMDWKTQSESIKMQRPEEYHFDKNKVIVSAHQSAYQGSFRSQNGSNQLMTAKDTKIMQNHKTIFKMYPNKHVSTYQDSYQSERYDWSQSQSFSQENQASPVPSSSHPSQFKSISSTSYRGVQERTCPAKLLKNSLLSQLQYVP